MLLLAKDGRAWRRRQAMPQTKAVADELGEAGLSSHRDFDTG